MSIWILAVFLIPTNALSLSHLFVHIRFVILHGLLFFEREVVLDISPDIREQMHQLN